MSPLMLSLFHSTYQPPPPTVHPAPQQQPTFAWPRPPADPEIPVPDYPNATTWRAGSLARGWGKSSVRAGTRPFLVVTFDDQFDDHFADHLETPPLATASR
jgi:hypothetical protein